MSVYEIEAKWELDFHQYVKLYERIQSFRGVKKTAGIDRFFERTAEDPNLLRLRFRPEGTSYVTTKKITGDYVRRENEIKLSETNTQEEVKFALFDMGYTEALQIYKSGLSVECHLNGSNFEAALYSAMSEEKVKYFLELELVKGEVNNKNLCSSVEKLTSSFDKFFESLLDNKVQETEIKKCDKMLWQYFI